MGNLFLIVSFLLFLVIVLWILFNWAMNWADRKRVLKEREFGDFVDSYKMEWLLRDENGVEFLEYFTDISLSDFEILYGNNVHEILMLELRLKYV